MSIMVASDSVLVHVGNICEHNVLCFILKCGGDGTRRSLKDCNLVPRASGARRL